MTKYWRGSFSPWNMAFLKNHPVLVITFTNSFSQFGNWGQDDLGTINAKFDMPESLQTGNGSLWMHTFVTPDGYQYPADAPSSKRAYRSQMVTKYKKLQK